MRTCVVNGKIGYFHCWEQYSQPMEASPFMGGPPAGVLARVYAAVDKEKEIDYQLRAVKAKLEAFGVVTEDLDIH